MGKLTQALMLELADRKRTLRGLADVTRGYVFIDLGALAEGEHEKPPVRVCGTALTGELERWQDKLAAKEGGLRATYGEARLHCFDPEPAAGAPLCRWTGRAEYDPSVDFVFRRDTSGQLTLRGIIAVDELGVAPAAVAGTRKQAFETLARIEKTAVDCTGRRN
jgi:hypothetical protein